MFSGCEEGYYKSKTSNGKCSKCPSGSTNNRTYTACNCKDKKYRLKDHLGVSSEPCYGKIRLLDDMLFTDMARPFHLIKLSKLAHVIHQTL